MNELIIADVASKIVTPENIGAVIDFVAGVIVELERRGELNPEQAAARREQLVAGLKQDHWQPKE